MRGRRSRPRIGEMLVERNLVTENDVAMALARQRESGRRLGETLFEIGAISSFDLARVLAERQGIEFVDLNECEPELEALACLPPSLAEQYGAIGIAVNANRLRVAMVNPNDPYALDDLHAVTGMEIDAVMADPAQILERSHAATPPPDPEPVDDAGPVHRPSDPGLVPASPTPEPVSAGSEPSAAEVAARVERELARLNAARVAVAASNRVLFSSIARDMWHDQYLLAYRNLADFLTNQRIVAGARAFAPDFPPAEPSLEQTIARLVVQTQWVDRYLAGPAAETPVDDELPAGRLEEMDRDLCTALDAFYATIDPAHERAFEHLRAQAGTSPATATQP